MALIKTKPTLPPNEAKLLRKKINKKLAKKRQHVRIKAGKYYIVETDNDAFFWRKERVVKSDIDLQDEFDRLDK